MNAADSLSAKKHLVEDLEAGDALGRLRQETAAAHRELDETLQLVDRLSIADQRIRLLTGYHYLHWQTEAKVAASLSEIADLDFLARRRSSLIAEGLRILGHTADLDGPAGVATITRAEAFGALYVLEGSSLGGRVILKELKRRKVSLAGLGFLDPYGADTGRRWRSFLAILEREIKSCEQKADAAKGALNAFAFAKLCLCKESTN
jgi:heme oxygenase (biliverdin-IX-beta and delta-forming)